MTERRYFAAGEYITRFPPGSPQEILIDSPREKQGWKERSPGGVTGAVFPGSAILFEDRYYELIRIERKAGEKPRYHYFLNPWEDAFPIRVQFAYTREACEREVAAAAQQKKEDAERTALVLLTPFTGLLPRPDQIRVENQYGLSALRATFISAFVMLLIGGGLLLLALVSILSPGSQSNIPVLGRLSPMLMVLSGMYLIVESVLRLITTRHDEAMGSLIVAGPIEIVRSFRRQFDPSYKQQQFERMESGKASVYLTAKDEVRRINETDLEIVSILPKPNWSAMTGISFNNTWYGCVETGTLRRLDQAHYRFVLREAPVGTAFRTTCVYTPEEVRDRYREKRKLELGTWVDTFAPVWGLLETQDQKRLEKTFGFNAMKYTAWTIVVLLVVGCANVFVSILNIYSGKAPKTEFLWLLAAGYFILESLMRLFRWLKNEPSGSVLSVLVRPLAMRLLQF